MQLQGCLTWTATYASEKEQEMQQNFLCGSILKWIRVRGKKKTSKADPEFG